LPEIEQTTKIRVENDTRIGLTGGLAGRPGIVLISGTGSACYGANDAGEQWLCGGWGAIADDIGSAPWIGTRALRAVVQAEDGRMPPTLLRKMVFDYLELQEPRQLIHRLHNEGLDRAEIGRLAPLVVEAFRQGDDAASKIIHDAAKGLSELLKATVDRLFGSSPCEMILVGGLALSGPPFQPLLMENIHNLTPNVTVRKPELAPVQGAVLEAMREAGIAWTDQILASLKLADLSQLQNKK
jgi:N-acetylglucosamine kinase-like BadF-type ATPase